MITMMITITETETGVDMKARATGQSTPMEVDCCKRIALLLQQAHPEGTYPDANPQYTFKEIER